MAIDTAPATASAIGMTTRSDDLMIDLSVKANYKPRIDGLGFAFEDGLGNYLTAALRRLLVSLPSIRFWGWAAAPSSSRGATTAKSAVSHVKGAAFRRSFDRRSAGADCAEARRSAVRRSHETSTDKSAVF